MHHGEAAWHFLTLPVELSDEIEARTASERRGFGSVRVVVTIGGTTWRTSLFPDSTAGAYLLPVKRAVRVREHLHDGDPVDVEIEVVDEAGTP
jgi:hypothetical protein